MYNISWNRGLYEKYSKQVGLLQWTKKRKGKLVKKRKERQNLSSSLALSVKSACGFSPPFLGFLFVRISRRTRDRKWEMGKNQAYKAMQRSRVGSSSAATNETDDGMVGPLPSLIYIFLYFPLQSFYLDSWCLKFAISWIPFSNLVHL